MNIFYFIISIFLISLVIVSIRFLWGYLLNKENQQSKQQPHTHQVKAISKHHHHETLDKDTRTADYQKIIEEKDQQIFKLTEALTQYAKNYIVNDLENIAIKQIDGKPYATLIKESHQDILPAIDNFLLKNNQKNDALTHAFHQQLLKDAELAEKGVVSCGWLIDLLLDAQFKNLDLYEQIKQYQYEFIIDAATKKSPALSVDSALEIYLLALDNSTQKDLTLQIIETIIVLQSIKAKNNEKLFQQYEKLFMLKNYAPPKHIVLLAQQQDCDLLRYMYFNIDLNDIDYLDIMFDNFHKEINGLLSVMEKDLKYHQDLKDNETVMITVANNIQYIKEHAHKYQSFTHCFLSYLRKQNLKKLYYSLDYHGLYPHLQNAIDDYFVPYNDFMDICESIKHIIMEYNRFYQTVKTFKHDIDTIAKTQVNLKDILDVTYEKQKN